MALDSKVLHCKTRWSFSLSLCDQNSQHSNAWRAFGLLPLKKRNSLLIKPMSSKAFQSSKFRIKRLPHNPYGSLSGVWACIKNPSSYSSMLVEALSWYLRNNLLPQTRQSNGIFPDSFLESTISPHETHGFGSILESVLLQQAPSNRKPPGIHP